MPQRTTERGPDLEPRADLLGALADLSSDPSTSGLDGGIDAASFQLRSSRAAANRTRWLLITVAGVIVAAVAAGSWWWLSREAATDADVSYTTETVTAGTLSVTVDGTGNLAVRDAVSATPSVSGTVESIDVAVGDAVEEGDTLYTLSSSSVEQAIASAKAGVQQASNQVAQAQLSVTQAKNSLTLAKAKLAASDPTATEADVEVAKQQVTIAQSGVTSARSSLSAANATYNDAVDAREGLEVTAPCDGTVWSISVEVGDEVPSGSTSSTSSGATGATTAQTTSSTSSTAPVTIARDGKMGVKLAVNEVDVTTIAVGQDATVVFDAVEDLSVAGKVDEIATEGTVSSGVVTYDVWITLDGSSDLLKVGMSASATVVTAVERNALLVSSAAVQTATDGTYYVQVLESGSTTPVQRTVEIGLVGSTQTVIVSGIEAGETVVTATSSASASTADSADDTQSSGGSGIMMLGSGSGPTGGAPAGGMPGGF